MRNAIGSHLPCSALLVMEPSGLIGNIPAIWGTASLYLALAGHTRQNLILQSVLTKRFHLLIVAADVIFPALVPRRSTYFSLLLYHLSIPA